MSYQFNPFTGTLDYVATDRFQGVLASAPANPSEGWTYINSGNSGFYFYAGGYWWLWNTLTRGEAGIEGLLLEDGSEFLLEDGTPALLEVAPVPPGAGDRVLLEDGSLLLLETGDAMLYEDGTTAPTVASYALMENGDRILMENGDLFTLE